MSEHGGRRPAPSLAADGCETGFEVGDDIVDVLGADGQADGVLIDLLLGQLLVVQLAVGGGSRVDDKALYVGDIGQKGEDLQVVDELEGFLTAALDIKGKDGSAAVRGNTSRTARDRGGRAGTDG